MAIHILRDYLTQNTGSAAKTWIPGYLLGIFLRRVLGYTYVGDTNYPINAVGSLLIATGDTTPTATPTFPANTRAGINQGPTREFYVWIPPSVRNVSLADVGRLLVLKSTANSTYNSGVYLITGFEALSYNISTTTGNGVNPITITTSAPHILSTGQTVTIAGVTGNTAANGIWTITVLNNTQFTINATGNGAFAGGGTVTTNSYIIDYRTMGTQPPQEAFNSMNWYLYERDSAAPVSGAQNSTWSTGSYGGNANSTTPRIILQSPHPLGWQVRLCHETYADYSLNVNNSSNFGAVPAITAAPGFGGNANGDYPIAGQHLHTAQYYNINNVGRPDTYIAATVGFGDDSAVNGSSTTYWPIQFRITMIGDDTGQSFALYSRRQYNATFPRSWIYTCGLPENEPLPLPVNNAARLFAFGSGVSVGGGSYGQYLNDISWSFAPPNGSTGTAYCQGTSQSQSGIPCSSVASLWTYAVGNSQLGSPIFDGSASDGAWANGTELMTVDILNGSISTWSATGTGTLGVNAVLPAFQLEPRVIGTVPLLRAGRANFGEYAVTTDANRTWLHLRRGVYMIWNGPQVIP